jgi:hypothetical protein
MHAFRGAVSLSARYLRERMPRYYFHVCDGEKRIISDSDGLAFETIEAVRREAIESARAAYDVATIRGTAASRHYQIEVTDAAGETVLTMPVGHSNLRLSKPPRTHS